jgi:hypothetical protein
VLVNEPGGEFVTGTRQCLRLVIIDQVSHDGDEAPSNDQYWTFECNRNWAMTDYRPLSLVGTWQ